MLVMLILGAIMYFFGVYSFIMYQKHMLSMLLSLEMMMFSIFVMLFSVLGSGAISSLVFYFVLSVCEASLGISLLILMVFYFGSDYIVSEGLLSC